MAATRPGRLRGRHRRPSEAQVTYGEVIAIGEFRALWLGQGMSLVGDQLAQVALAILVYNRTHSALATAAVYALTYLPPIIGGPLLAGLADRYPRRRVMLGCDLIRAVLVAAMAVPGMPFWSLCALVFCVVLLSAPFSAARAALLPEVLEGDQYVVGSALQNVTSQAVQMLGFAAGGAVIAGLGPYRALALDSATFLGSALIIAAGVGRRPSAASADDNRPSMWTMTRAGGRLVFGDRRLRTLVLFAWLCGFYVLPEGIAVPYAAELDRGTMPLPLITGLLMAAMPTVDVAAAADGVDGHADLRTLDRVRPEAPVADRPRAVVPVRHRGRLPTRGQCGLRTVCAGRAPGPGLRARPVRPARRPGHRPPHRRRRRTATRPRARGCLGGSRRTGGGRRAGHGLDRVV
jgi:MFS family permease